jgi:hypothetical protein
VAEVCKDEAVAEIMELGGQIGQVLTLVNQKGKRVVVANTHLFGNPDAPHVRILQMQMLMAAVAAARDDAGGNQVMGLTSSPRLPIFFNVFRALGPCSGQKPPNPRMSLEMTLNPKPLSGFPFSDRAIGRECRLRVSCAGTPTLSPTAGQWLLRCKEPSVQVTRSGQRVALSRI